MNARATGTRAVLVSLGLAVPSVVWVPVAAAEQSLAAALEQFARHGYRIELATPEYASTPVAQREMDQRDPRRALQSLLRDHSYALDQLSDRHFRLYVFSVADDASAAMAEQVDPQAYFDPSYHVTASDTGPDGATEFILVPRASAPTPYLETIQLDGNGVPELLRELPPEAVTPAYHDEIVAGANGVPEVIRTPIAPAPGSLIETVETGPAGIPELVRRAPGGDLAGTVVRQPNGQIEVIR